MPNLSNLLLALLLTEIVELPLAWLWGYRRRSDLITFALINLITNPLLNYLLLINSIFNWFAMSRLTVLVLEIAVVLVEWLILCYALGGKRVKLFVVSLSLNFCSWLTGAMLFS